MGHCQIKLGELVSPHQNLNLNILALRRGIPSTKKSSLSKFSTSVDRWESQIMATVPPDEFLVGNYLLEKDLIYARHISCKFYDWH
jgi:hypothetical protein